MNENTKALFVGAFALEDTRTTRASVLPWEKADTERVSSGRSTQISLMGEGKESRFNSQRSAISGFESKAGVPDWLRDTQRKDSSDNNTSHGAFKLEDTRTTRASVLPWEKANTEHVSSGRSTQIGGMGEGKEARFNSQKSTISGLESKIGDTDWLRDPPRKDSSVSNKSHGAFALENNRTTRASVLSWNIANKDRISAVRSRQTSLMGEGEKALFHSQKSTISGLESKTDVPDWLRDTQRKDSSVLNKSHGVQRKSHDKALAKEDLDDMSWLETVAEPQSPQDDSRAVLSPSPGGQNWVQKARGSLNAVPYSTIAFEFEDTRRTRASVLPWEMADTGRISSGHSTQISLMGEGYESRFNAQKSTISGLESKTGVPDWLRDTQQKDSSVSNKSHGPSPGGQNWIQKARESLHTVPCSTITKKTVISDDLDWLMKARASLTPPASPPTARSCRSETKSPEWLQDTKARLGPPRSPTSLRKMLDDDSELADDLEEIMTQMRKDYEETHSPRLAVVLQNLQKDMRSHGDTVANDEQMRTDIMQNNYVYTQRVDDEKSNQPMTTFNENFKYYIEEKHEPYQAGQTVSDANTESSISLKPELSDDEFWGSKSENKSKACDDHAHALFETKDKQESHSEKDNTESYSLRLPESPEDSDYEGDTVASETLNNLETLPDQCDETLEIQTNVSTGSPDLPNPVHCQIGNDTFKCQTFVLAFPVPPNLKVPKISVVGACNKETKLTMMQNQRLQKTCNEMDSETTSETRDVSDELKPRGKNTDGFNYNYVYNRDNVEFSKFKNDDNCTNDDCVALPPKYHLKVKDEAPNTRMAQIENEVRFLKQTSIIQSQEVRILALERAFQENKKKLSSNEHEFKQITLAKQSMESLEIDKQVLGTIATVLNRIEYANKPTIVSDSDKTINKSVLDEIDATESTKSHFMKQKSNGVLAKTLTDQSTNTDVSGTKYSRSKKLPSKSRIGLSEYVSVAGHEPHTVAKHSAIDFKSRRNKHVYWEDTDTQHDANSSATKNNRTKNQRTHDKTRREFQRQRYKPEQEHHNKSVFSDLSQVNNSHCMEASLEPKEYSSYPNELQPSINVQNSKNVINIFCFPRKPYDSGKNRKILKHENVDMFGKDGNSEKNKTGLITVARNFVANLKSKLFSCRQDVSVSDDEVTNNERLLNIVSSHVSPTPSMIVIEPRKGYPQRPMVYYHQPYAQGGVPYVRTTNTGRARRTLTTAYDKNITELTCLPIIHNELSGSGSVEAGPESKVSNSLKKLFQSLFKRNV